MGIFRLKVRTISFQDINDGSIPLRFIYIPRDVYIYIIIYIKKKIYKVYIGVTRKIENK